MPPISPAAFPSTVRWRTVVLALASASFAEPVARKPFGTSGLIVTPKPTQNYSVSYGSRVYRTSLSALLCRCDPIAPLRAKIPPSPRVLEKPY